MGVIAREHRDEWVSYCPHVDDETGAQACQCAPDLREVVEERDAAQQQLKGAVAALRKYGRHGAGCAYLRLPTNPCDCDWETTRERLLGGQ